MGFDKPYLKSQIPNPVPWSAALVLFTCLTVVCSVSSPAGAVPVTFDIVIEGVAYQTSPLPFGLTDVPTGVVGYVVVDINGAGNEEVNTSSVPPTIMDFYISFGTAVFDLVNSLGSLKFADGLWMDANTYVTGISGNYQYDATHSYYMSLGNYWLRRGQSSFSGDGD